MVYRFDTDRHVARAPHHSQCMLDAAKKNKFKIVGHRQEIERGHRAIPTHSHSHTAASKQAAAVCFDCVGLSARLEITIKEEK